jgi:hypothetical protein
VYLRIFAEVLSMLKIIRSANRKPTMATLQIAKIYGAQIANPQIAPMAQVPQI